MRRLYSQASPYFDILADIFHSPSFVSCFSGKLVYTKIVEQNVDHDLNFAAIRFNPVIPESENLNIYGVFVGSYLVSEMLLYCTYREFHSVSGEQDNKVGGGHIGVPDKRI
jgi:hypothetical protein